MMDKINYWIWAREVSVQEYGGRLHELLSLVSAPNKGVLEDGS